jgi:hypothetical protein
VLDTGWLEMLLSASSCCTFFPCRLRSFFSCFRLFSFLSLFLSRFPASRCSISSMSKSSTTDRRAWSEGAPANDVVGAPPCRPTGGAPESEFILDCTMISLSRNSVHARLCYGTAGDGGTMLHVQHQSTPHAQSIATASLAATLPGRRAFSRH